MAFTRIDWVAEHCRLLRSISAEFQDTLPFRGLTIGTGIHLEAKTVALILTLRDGGARLVSTGNLNTTQPQARGREQLRRPRPGRDRRRHRHQLSRPEVPRCAGGLAHLNASLA